MICSYAGWLSWRGCNETEKEKAEEGRNCERRSLDQPVWCCHPQRAWPRVRITV